MREHQTVGYWLWSSVLATTVLIVSGGVAGSSNYDHSGDGVNYLCLPLDPEWGEPTVDSASGSYVSGVKYDFPDGNSPFLKVV